MCTHMHAHNKVPECSVYIIAFEMVMHEPVNQLAADKRAGPCPQRTHVGLRTRAPTQNYLQPAQSNIFYYRTFYSLLVSLHSSFYCPGVFLVYVGFHKNHKICNGNLICKIIFKT